jgi:hypothetical protein
MIMGLKHGTVQWISFAASQLTWGRILKENSDAEKSPFQLKKVPFQQK